MSTDTPAAQSLQSFLNALSGLVPPTQQNTPVGTSSQSDSNCCNSSSQSECPDTCPVGCPPSCECPSDEKSGDSLKVFNLPDVKSILNNLFSVSNSEFYDSRMDVTEETDGAIVAHLDVPGFTQENLHVTLLNGRMIISGERTLQRSKTASVRSFFERTPGTFRRVLLISTGVNVDGITTVLSNGVLTVNIPAPVYVNKTLTITTN